MAAAKEIILKNRVRMDDIRSISYLQRGREFTFSVGQTIGMGTVSKIQEDEHHFIVSGKMRYFVWVNNGSHEKVWKSIPEDATGVIIEQFL